MLITKRTQFNKTQNTTMQSKLVAVASIAASVGAMKLETNNLA